MLSSQEIRQRYLKFFEEKGHLVLPSASLIPVNDPSLLWVNSGVATLKKYFDGSEIPECPRLTSSQKSIRTNDIDNVGVTARHHTLFEMLGNFSIGNYFKHEAIPWAWEFLTDKEKGLGLDPERLYVTYYPEDTETKELWIKNGVDESHIYPVDDNFWDLGAGPCGPDTEIFYDRGEAYQDLEDDDPENYPGGENERYLEIWNLVFSQFNHQADDSYVPLPHKNVDTGMGLERVTSVIQDTPTNFETDLFMPIIRQVESLTGAHYDDSEEIKVSFKVIADHARAVTFAISDGALPSNEGRGYIIRRLIRRSVMHGNRLGIQQQFLYNLVPIVGEIMGGHYPQIVEKEAFIQKVIKSEEDRFFETLHGGLDLLNSYIEEQKSLGNSVVEGPIAFKLYDTYGFPLELTLEYAKEANFTVDEKGFEAEMAKQKERARSSRNKTQSMNVQSETLRTLETPSEFLYGTDEADTTITAIIFEDELVESVSKGNEVEIVTEKTPFYAEMGGQVSDTGVILSEDGQQLGRVTNIKRAPNGQNVHIVELDQPVQLGQKVHLEIDHLRRRLIERNHIATHLFHQALKDVLGKHANQAGSLVNEDLLRFDFSHFGQVTSEQLKEMEDIVNDKIARALPVRTIETTLEKAKEMGAMALFGEKYGKKVRVVNVDNWSIELCGGTHVSNTAEIGLFKIISESGIGAGIRRIEARTSLKAIAYLEEQEALLKELQGQLKVPQVSQLSHKVSQLQDQIKSLQQEKESLLSRQMQKDLQGLTDQIETIGDVRLIIKEEKGLSMNDMRHLADQWRQAKTSDVLAISNVADDKVQLLVAVSAEAEQKGLHAGQLIKAISPAIQGGGGGKASLAQAGGKKVEGLNQAFEDLRLALSK
ncbi:alanine--tRNA ligase [Atopobacter sp. AH10]|uniref:alanine--tRNA ligase n=1 Tax=Atopobacter sp. AH10 TaxID=2315861 RepID=UPI000EF1DB65|nr:alanine--tRNA ligase [Atopobacter sp. AH10]RLK62987.1 alanine--tRNA ligase [Atopobacter sp. AH10]